MTLGNLRTICINSHCRICIKSNRLNKIIDSIQINDCKYDFYEVINFYVESNSFVTKLIVRVVD